MKKVTFLAAALLSVGMLFSADSFAQSERKDNRDAKQEGRQDNRDEKQDGRQDNRDGRQEDRKN